MEVTDIDGTYTVADTRELEAVLSRRYADGMNAYWLFGGCADRPALSLLVKGDLATLAYFPFEGDAGFRSVGEEPGLEPGEMTRFALSRYLGDDVFVLNDAVVPISLALQAAKEFFVSKDIPKCVQWFRL